MPSSMLIGEPPPSQADLHFRLLGIPVRVHPLFWLFTVILALRPDADPVNVLIWVVVVFVSILVHEFGHALTQRYFGGRPWVTLYSFGGLATCNDCDRSPRSQILILLAGPGAGFLLAAIILAAIRLSGHDAGIVVGSVEQLFRLNVRELVGFQLVGPTFVYFDGYTSDLLGRSVMNLLQVNILWGLLNLLPIYPLDGGQLSREILSLRNPRGGIIRSLQISVGMAAVVAVYALFNQSLFLCIMFGMLAYESYKALQAYQNYWR